MRQRLLGGDLQAGGRSREVCYDPPYRTLATRALTAAGSSASGTHKHGDLSVTQDAPEHTRSSRMEGMEIQHNLQHLSQTFFSLI